MNSRVTFVTPTYDRDLERFTLLRESMERCHVDIPHIAVVDHEDLPLFEKVPFRHNLTFLSSRDVLPADIETRRTARGYPRRHPNHWIKPKPIHGWGIQQIMKLSAPEYVDTEGILCLDSDVFFVKSVVDADFFTPDGRLHLYEAQEGLTVETITWMAQSMRTLQVPLSNPPSQFIHNPVPMHRKVVQGLRSYMEKLHGKRWIEVFLEHNLTEYMTHGVYARYVNGLEHVASVAPPFTLNHWLAQDLADIENTLLQQIEATGAKVVLINSNIGRPADSYRHLVERAWLAAEGKR